MSEIGTLFSVLPDPRASDVRHRLADGLVVALAASPCGTRACSDTAVVRAHSTIENGRHWALDVFMDQDRCRARRDDAAENLARLRRIVLDILRTDPGRAARGDQTETGSDQAQGEQPEKRSGQRQREGAAVEALGRRVARRAPTPVPPIPRHPRLPQRRAGRRAGGH